MDVNRLAGTRDIDDRVVRARSSATHIHVVRGIGHLLPHGDAWNGKETAAANIPRVVSS